jgi:hypothetical protein
VTPSDTNATVSQANIIDAANGSGIITGAIDTATRVDVLKTLTASDAISYYHIVINALDASSEASALNLIDSRTNIDVDAALVTTVTGTATEVAAFAAADVATTIIANDNFNSTITSGDATFTQMQAIDDVNGSGDINMTSVGSLTGLTAGDIIDFFEATFNSNIGLSGTVISTGEYSFIGGTLTYYDDVTSSVDTITLTGVADVFDAQGYLVVSPI